MHIALETLTIALFFTIISLFIQGYLTKTALACFIVGWSFFYDYFTYHLELILGFELLSIKLFFELLLITATIILLFRKHIERREIISIFVLIFVIAAASINGLLTGQSIKEIYISFRAIFLPLLLCLILFSIRYFDNIRIETVIHFGILILFINGIQASWDYLNFDGNYESFWRYQSLLKSNIKLFSENYNEAQLVYQLVRDGQLRSSGFLVSALISSYLYAFAAIYFLSQSFTLRQPHLFRNLLLFAIFLAFIYVTHVRAGFVMVALAFATLSVYKLLRSDSMRRLASLVIPSTAFFALMLHLSYGEGLGIDPSSLGRVDQYNKFISEFVPQGHGLGAFPRMFDSFFIYIFLELGILAILFLWVIYRTLLADQSSEKLRILGVYFSVFLFLSTFQHVAGTAYYSLFLFYLFLYRQVGGSSSRVGRAIAPTSHKPMQ